MFFRSLFVSLCLLPSISSSRRCLLFAYEYIKMGTFRMYDDNNELKCVVIFKPKCYGLLFFSQPEMKCKSFISSELAREFKMHNNEFPHFYYGLTTWPHCTFTLALAWTWAIAKIVKNIIFSYTNTHKTNKFISENGEVCVCCCVLYLFVVLERKFVIFLIPLSLQRLQMNVVYGLGQVGVLCGRIPKTRTITCVVGRWTMNDDSTDPCMKSEDRMLRLSPHNTHVQHKIYRQVHRHLSV